MQMKLASRTFAAIAVAISVTGCAHRVEAAATPPPTQILTEANRAKIAEVARKLEAQDRTMRQAHRREIDRLIDASVLQVQDGDRETSLLLHIRNKSGKAIRAFDAGLEMRLLASHRRIGLTELHLTRAVPAGAEATFWVPLRYVRFGEDTASMRLAQGKSKRADVEVTEIKYVDGSDAGYDD